ncbi:MAG TPA: putative Ig domain-containing protein [Acidimicrobiia bacterium]|nr:putative Ig domain-containing protein [Acidimicrobiia bacterium]
MMISRKIATSVAALAIAAPSVAAVVAPVADAAAAAPAPSMAAREVRTTWTSEIGVDRPEGVTYVPGRDELLVASPSETGTAVARLETDGEPKGDFALPPISDVATLAYDPTSDQLAGVDGQDVVVAPAPTQGNAATTPVDGGADALAEPSGSSFDPATGTWYVLDAGHNVIVASAEGAAPESEPQSIPMPQLAGKTLRGVAFNPQDGLLYVGSPDENLLYAVDTSGAVVQSYDLTGLGLRDAGSMTFAPSADPTDAASTQHLYVADSGDTTQLGSVMELTLAAEPVLAAAVVDDTGTLVQTIDTSKFSPGSPDPSGVTYLPGKDRLMLCDSEVEETTGAGYHGVNMWEINRNGAVTDTGTTYPAISKEPNGVGYIAASNTLLISDDSLRRIHLMRPGPDNRFGTADDVVTFINAAAYGSDDTEDPTYDPVSGDIFFMDGVATEVFRVSPVDGIFGNGNDTMTHFDVGQYGISDTEALEYYPPNDSLIVGNRTDRELIEVTKTGQLLRTIDLSGVPGLKLVSGLTVAPASNGTGQLNYWIVDRGQDNGANSSENDGKLYEVAAGTVDNTAPVVDSVVINQSAPKTNDTLSATVTAHDDDGDPLTYLYQWRKNGVSLTNQTGPTLDLSIAGNGDKGDAISLRVNAFDGIVQSAPRTSAQVTVVNTNPVFGQNLLNRTDTAGATVSFSAAATDADGDPLIYEATNLPSGVTINASSGAISGTIATGAAASSPYSVAVTVRDGAAPAATDTFTWTVNAAPPTNTAPVVDSVVINQSAPKTNDTLSATVTAHDNDGDPLTYTYQWQRNGTNIPGGNAPSLDLSVAGHGNKGDQISVRVVASDGDLPSAPVTSAAVTIANSEPVFSQNLANRTDAEDDLVVTSAAATDADNDALSYEATNLPGGIGINPATGVISGTITIGAAASSPYSTAVTVRDGPTVDATDTFTWNVTAAPIVRSGAVTTTEGDTGSHIVTVPVTLSHASASTVTVDWATTASVQPEPGVDFEAASGTVTFVPGDVNETVEITINGDVVDEPGQLWGAEWGVIELSSPAHAALGAGPSDDLGLFLIVDDDPPPTIMPTSVAVTEGNSGSKIATVTVNLSAPSANTVTVNWATANSAQPEPGVDFVAASGAVTFLPGETTKTVPLTVLGDTIDEPGNAWGAEWAAIVFSSPHNAKLGAQPFSNVSFVLIVDDD